LKYSISEANHNKGYLVVNLDHQEVTIEKIAFEPKRDMRRVIGAIADIERHSINEDYVYVSLTDDNPVLFPMEKIRAVYPNAMHVDRITSQRIHMENKQEETTTLMKHELKPLELFAAFYEEVRGSELTQEKRERFAEAYEKMMQGSEQ